MTELSDYIQAAPLVDTHEHLYKEAQYVNDGPDILEDLFAKNYIVADLEVAGATPEAVERLRDSRDPNLEARWNGVKEAWEFCKHTAYGETVRMIAHPVSGLEELTLSALLAAREINVQRRQPGERLRILREEGNLDHVQVDDLVWECLPDASGPDFFLYDLSWRTLSSGEVDAARLHREFGVEVTDANTLRAALAAIFERWAPCAIAVKSQHAYDRTLRWEERTDAEADQVLRQQLAGRALSPDEKLCLGDWCLARGVELAVEHNLPFKIHTGYFCRVNRLVMDHIHAGHLTNLLLRYPSARFILMHAGYPFTGEMIAVAKHFPSVCVDMSWIWNIDPLAAVGFLRRMIHTVPINKLFVFGGDTLWPTAAVAHAKQARQWLNSALQGEVDDRFLTENEAIGIAARLMRLNQYDCFNLAGTRASVHARLPREKPS